MFQHCFHITVEETSQPDCFQHRFPGLPQEALPGVRRARAAVAVAAVHGAAAAEAAVALRRGQAHRRRRLRQLVRRRQRHEHGGRGDAGEHRLRVAQDLPGALRALHDHILDLLHPGGRLQIKQMKKLEVYREATLLHAFLMLFF